MRSGYIDPMLKWVSRSRIRGLRRAPGTYLGCSAHVVRVALALLVLTGCGGKPSPEPSTVPAESATVTAERFLPHVPTSPTPTPTSEATTGTLALPPDPTPTALPEPTDRPAPVAPDALASSAADATAYTVRAGDTLSAIAQAHGVPMAGIQLSSEMGAETMVRVGQVLQIPASSAWLEASSYWIVHQVTAGETLSEVAKGYGIGLDELLSVNGLADADLIAVGQLLVLPLEGPVPVAVGVASVPAPAPDPTEAPSPTSVAEAEAPATETPVPTPAPSPEPPADVAALPGIVFRLLNEQRAAYGLPALAWDETLAAAAQLHANDCYERGWCSHVGSDGSTYKERIIRAGYDPVRWSECWAWYGTPELAVAMWMDEVPPNDPHRRTILSDYLEEVGVGVVPGSGHGYYFIADFGTPR